MSSRMLVRGGNGGWERLESHAELGTRTLRELIGDDIGPVVGSDRPVLVVADRPDLGVATPDALCVTADGEVVIVQTALTPQSSDPLPSLLAHAGSLHGMTFERFESLCNVVTESGMPLTTYVHERNPHAEFHGATFEVAVSDALAQGRFQLVAMVGDASPSLRQSLRYLNASGNGDTACYELSAYSADSVTALQVEPVDVGQAVRDTSLRMTAAGMAAITSRTIDERAGDLLGVLLKFCAGTFDTVEYGGTLELATMHAKLRAGEALRTVVEADSSGAIVLNFDALGQSDDAWTARTELAQGIGRMLGSNLGNPRKIQRINLSLAEHLNDASLMEMFSDVIGDALTARRGQQAVAA